MNAIENNEIQEENFTRREIFQKTPERNIKRRKFKLIKNSQANYNLRKSTNNFSKSFAKKNMEVFNSFNTTINLECNVIKNNNSNSQERQKNIKQINIADNIINIDYKDKNDHDKEKKKRRLENVSVSQTPLQHQERKLLNFPDISIPNQSQYEIHNPVGEGAYARVYNAVCKETNELVAIKVYSKEYFTKPHRITNLRNEVSLLYELNHPNIIQLYNICESHDCVSIIMENGGKYSLERLIIDKFGLFIFNLFMFLS